MKNLLCRRKLLPFEYVLVRISLATGLGESTNRPRYPSEVMIDSSIIQIFSAVVSLGKFAA